jgi:hypothetical protein
LHVARARACASRRIARVARTSRARSRAEIGALEAAINKKENAKKSTTSCITCFTVFMARVLFRVCIVVHVASVRRGRIVMLQMLDTERRIRSTLRNTRTMEAAA